jgi:hypothetical protein
MSLKLTSTFVLTLRTPTSPLTAVAQKYGAMLNVHPLRSGSCADVEPQKNNEASTVKPTTQVVALAC